MSSVIIRIDVEIRSPSPIICVKCGRELLSTTHMCPLTTTDSYMRNRGALKEWIFISRRYDHKYQSEDVTLFVRTLDGFFIYGRYESGYWLLPAKRTSTEVIIVDVKGFDDIVFNSKMTPRYLPFGGRVPTLSCNKPSDRFHATYDTIDDTNSLVASENFDSRVSNASNSLGKPNITDDEVIEIAILRAEQSLLDPYTKETIMNAYKLSCGHIIASSSRHFYESNFKCPYVGCENV